MEVNTDIQTPLVDDGGGGNPPPAGYVPTNPTQRKDWNGFVDYLKSQGNVNLADPQVGANFINQYKQNNPNFSITPEMIPAIQYENSQLRAGDSFGNLNADQLKNIRAGMSPNFLNTNDVYKSYYPQFKSGSQDFGTDVEGYVNSKGNVPAAPAIVPTSSPTSSPAPAGLVPKPDYSNAQSRLNFAHNIVKQYGPELSGRGDTFLRVNEVPDTDNDTETPKQFTEKAASKVGIDPTLLYASAMEEGMSGLWKDKNGTIPITDDPKYPVDGFVNFGLDNFADNFKGLVKKGYLDKDFADEFKSAKNTNEKGQTVNSANFKSAAGAMQAKAAMIKDSQDTTEAYAKSNNIPLSDKAKQFFTLVAYNAGEGNMQKMLKEYNRNGYLKDDKFIQKRPSDSWKGPYSNVITRIKAADVLKKEGLWQNQ